MSTGAPVRALTFDFWNTLVQATDEQAMWRVKGWTAHYKPSREIFEHALGYLGSAPSQTAHIGDIRRTDVAGGRGMGMTAVRYKAVADDTDETYPEGHHVIDHHDELFEVLGIA